MLKTNKVVSGVVAFAMVFAFVASFVAPALADTTMMTTTGTSMNSGSMMTTTGSMMTAGYTFNTNLTIGSTGPAVSELQTVLVAKGFLMIPSGTSMGYFGTLTKNALASMQAAVGISPASGYFGPISRAYFAAHPELTNGSMSTGTGMTMTPGCTTGAMYNSMTGAPCSTTTTGTGTTTTCPAGYTCTQTGGTSTGTTNTTAEGTLTVYQGTVGSSGNIQTNVDVPVYSLQLRAQQGDVRVDRIDLQVIDTIGNGSQTENPANFINNVKVMDGDTNAVLVNRNVSISDFVTGTSSTTYYLRLSGLGFTIPAGSTKNLVVDFSTSGSIDTQRMLVIKGYGAASLLAYSGVNNTASYYDISGLQSTQTFTKPGNTTVVIGVDQSNPLSMTNYVDPISGANKVTMLAFNTNTNSGTSQLNQVTATVNTSSTGTAPTALYLYQGGNIISSRGVSGANATTTFDNLPTTSTSGNTVYTIKADFPAGTATGTVARVNVVGANFINTNGNNQSANQIVAGNNQYFYPVTANLQFVSASAVANNNTNSGGTTNVAVTFNFTMTPYPGSAVQPRASDFTIARVNGATGVSTTTGSTTINSSKVLQITPTPTNNTLGSGQPYTLQLTANDVGPGAGAYYYIITSASTTVNDSSGNPLTVNRTWGFDNFKTNNVVTQ